MIKSVLDVIYLTHTKFNSNWKDESVFNEDYFNAILSIKESLSSEEDIVWLNENYIFKEDEILNCLKRD